MVRTFNFEQFKAILWLRSRLTANQLRRLGAFGVVGAVIATVLVTGFAIGSGLIALLVGIFLEALSPGVIGYIWDCLGLATLFFAIIGILQEVQRSESIDLTKLLHLPISLRQVFFINYVASLVSFSGLFMICSMTGLTLGMAVSQGPRFLALLPLVAGFVFMVTAWIYCVRGWLAALMTNKRRRRTIVTVITLGIILLSQLPNLLNMVFNPFMQRAKSATAIVTPVTRPNDPTAPLAPGNVDNFTERATTVIAQAQTWVPIFWVGNAARGLAEGNPLPALWGGAGLFVIGWLGMRRAYRSTMRFYLAEEKDSKPAAAPVALATAPSTVPAKLAPTWIERRFPGAADDTAAMAWLQLRSMTRAPEVRMIMVTALFMSFLVPMMVFWRSGANLPDAMKPFVATLMMGFIWFFALQLASNQFGADRDGFRALVLLPTSRARILLGKNIALGLMMSGQAAVVLTIVAVVAHLSVLMVLMAMVQFINIAFLACTMGNLTSIIVPFRVGAGSLKPTKLPAQTMLFVIFMNMMFPMAISPVLIPPALSLLAQHLVGAGAAAPVGLLAALVMTVLLALGYRAVLRPLGDMFQNRETKILQAVTANSE